MDKCWEIINESNGEKYGIWLDRADAEEMALAFAEEEAYEIFCLYWMKWEDSLEISLLQGWHALWRIFIIEHNLFK